MTVGSFVSGNMEYLRRPFVRNVKRGDRLLVLTDTAHDARVWQVVQSILSELGADVTVALFERRPADYYDPPAAVCESMMKSDINVLIASTGMLHCPANFRAMEAGIPAICMDGGMTLEMVPIGRGHRRHETDRRQEALCRQGRVRSGREGMPGDLALRHGVQLSGR